MIEVKELKKSFGALEVLKGVTFGVDKGEVVVVLGPSGSGKSTVLRCLNLLEDYEGGDAYYAPPGHILVVTAGTEMIEFSPTEEYGRTLEVVGQNLEAMQNV